MHLGFLTPEYVTPDQVNGGLANYLQKLGRALTERGHQATILLAGDRTATWLDGAVQVREIKRVVPSAAWLRGRLGATFAPVVVQYWTSRRLADEVWRLHQARPFDLLQASSFQAPGYALRRNGRIPVVCRVSSYSPLLRSAFGRPCLPSEYLADWLELRQVLDAEATFSPSQFIAGEVARHTSCEPVVIRTPMASARAARPDPAYVEAHLSGVPYLLMVGSLSRVKGTDLLGEIAPALWQECEQLKLVFVGRDDGMPDGTRIMDYLRSRCGARAGQLHHVSALTRAQLDPVIAGAVGVLMLSRVDNYPNACLEAQAWGIPVVGSRASSLDEMIEDGGTGFLVENSSASSLLAGIRRLLRQTPAERQAMQARLRARVAEIEGEDRVGQLLEFYESVRGRFVSRRG